MSRLLRIHPCPTCDTNRVHDGHGRWACPSCEWSRSTADARRAAIDAARARHYGTDPDQ